MSATKTTKPKTIWGARINLNGLYAKQALKCIWNSDLKSWWDSSGDLVISKLGQDFDKDFRVITFASENKTEVEYWIKGARSCLTLIASWAHSSYIGTIGGLKALE